MIFQRLLIAVTILSLASCNFNNQSSADSKPTMRSFEIDPTNGKDTINIIDNQGRKQGLWLNRIHTNNMITVSDTLFYKNDTLVSPQ